MINTRSKGNRARRKAIEQLEMDGFRVAVIERTGKFIKDKDAFGIGDLLAISETNIPIIIQVTCNKPHTHKPYKEFAKLYSRYMGVMQMIWIDGKGFKHYIYRQDGTYKRIDYK